MKGKQFVFRKFGIKVRVCIHHAFHRGMNILMLHDNNNFHCIQNEDSSLASIRLMLLGHSFEFQSFFMWNYYKRIDGSGTCKAINLWKYFHPHKGEKAKMPLTLARWHNDTQEDNSLQVHKKLNVPNIINNRMNGFEIDIPATPTSNWSEVPVWVKDFCHLNLFKGAPLPWMPSVSGFAPLLISDLIGVLMISSICVLLSHRKLHDGEFLMFLWLEISNLFSYGKGFSFVATQQLAPILIQLPNTINL